MNKLDVILAKKCDVQDQNLQYGLYPLHAWIRFLEYFLNVAFRKEICKQQAHGTEAKEAVKARQRYIQSELRSRLSITVDVPGDGGSGTLNTSNAARRFFKVNKTNGKPSPQQTYPNDKRSLQHLYCKTQPNVFYHKNYTFYLFHASHDIFMERPTHFIL